MMDGAMKTLQFNCMRFMSIREETINNSSKIVFFVEKTQLLCVWLFCRINW